MSSVVSFPFISVFQTPIQFCFSNYWQRTAARKSSDFTNSHLVLFLKLLATATYKISCARNQELFKYEPNKRKSKRFPNLTHSTQLILYFVVASFYSVRISNCNCQSVYKLSFSTRLSLFLFEIVFSSICIALGIWGGLLLASLS